MKSLFSPESPINTHKYQMREKNPYFSMTNRHLSGLIMKHKAMNLNFLI